MAELVFKTQADYEEVMKLREQIKALREEMTELNKQNDSRNRDRIQALGTEYTMLKDRLTELTQEATKAGSSFDDLGRKLDSQMRRLIGIVALKQFTQQVLQLRMEFQDAESTMITFLGTAEKGSAFFKELKDYAWYNMFEFKDLQQASTQLIAYGNAQKDLIPILDKLSNVASGTNKSLMQYVEMWNRAKSIGYVDSRSMQTWAASGIELKRVLEDIGEKVQGNRVSFEQLQKAIDAVTSEGGQFFGTMNNKMSNLSASIGQLQDNWANMLNEIGVKSQDTFKSVIEAAAWAIDNYRTLGKVLASLIATYGTYRAGLLVALGIEKLRNTSLKQLTAQLIKAAIAQNLLNASMKANVIIGIISLVAGLVAALVTFRKASKDATDAQEQLTEEQKSSISTSQQEMAALKSLCDVARDEKATVDERRNAIKQINASYGEYLGNLLSEKATVNDIADAYARAAENMKRSHLAKKQEEIVGDTGTKTYEFIDGLVSDPKAMANLQKAVRDYISSNEEDMETFSHAIEEAFEQDMGIVGDWAVKQEEALVGLAKEYRDSYQSYNRYASAYSDAVDDMLDSDAKYIESSEKVNQRIKDNEKELKNLQDRSKSGWDKKDKKRAEELETAIKNDKALYKSMTGRDYQGGAQAAKSSQAYQETQRKQAKDEERQKVDLEREATQARINAMKEGSAKTLAQMELDRQKEIDTIDRWYEDLRDEKIRKEKELYEANPAHKNGVFTYDPNDPKYNATDKEERNRSLRMTAANEKYKQGLRKFYIDIYDSAETYSTKMFTLNEDYEKQMSGLRSREAELTERLANEKDEAVRKSIEYEIGLNKEAQESVKENREQAIKDTYDDVLSTATDYESRMTSVKEKYDKQRRDLDKRSVEIQRELAEAKTDEQKEALKKEAELNEKAIKQSDANRQKELKAIERDFSSVYSFIFQDVSSFTTKQLEKAIELVNGQIAEAKGDAEQLKSLYDQLLKMQEAQRRPKFGWGGISSGFGLLREAGSLIGANLRQGETAVEAERRNNEGFAKQAAGYEAINKGAEDLLNTLDDISRIFDDFDENLDDTSKALANIGKTLKGLAEGGQMIASVFSNMERNVDEATGEVTYNVKDMGSAISTVVSGTVQLLSMVASSIAKNKQAQKEWNLTVQATADAYASLKLDELRYSQKNIFGVEDPFKKASDSAELYRQSMEEISKTTDRLLNGQVQTGTKKALDWEKIGKGFATGVATGAAAGAIAGGGVFSWATTGVGALVGGIAGAVAGLVSTKVEPVFDSLKSHYDWIFDNKTYELNPQLLADYDKLDEETKEIVDHWKEVQEKAQEAIDDLKDNLSDFTGDTGKKLEDMLVNAWTNRRLYSAVDEFKDYVSDSIAQIMQDRIFSVMFSDIFDEFENRMTSSYLDDNGDQSIIDDLNWLEGEYQKRLGYYDQAMEAAQAEMERMGYKGFKNRQTNANATSGSVQNISETTGSAIQGGVTALRLSSEERNRQLTLMGANLEEMLRQQLSVTHFAEDIRNIQVDSYLALVAIRDNTAGNLATVRGIAETVSSIEKRTRGL